MQNTNSLHAVFGLAALGLITMVATAACDGSGSTSSDDGPGPNGPPRGAAACYDRYLTKLSADCSVDSCGEVLECEIDWDCTTCADRCNLAACGSDADCEAEYGDLCDNVEWRCEPYITSSNYRCAVYDVGDSRCGDGACSADEDCDNCVSDCGYCPGTAPAMAPCEYDSYCASGVCDKWCVDSCSSGWDCVGDHTGVLYGDCVAASNGAAQCFPDCTVVGGCDQYPGTKCVSVTSVDGFGVEVCAPTGGGSTCSGDYPQHCSSHGVSGCFGAEVNCDSVVDCGVGAGIVGCSGNDRAVDCETNTCLPTLTSEGSNSACSDGIDNDNNGFSDCDDFQCFANPLVYVCGLTEVTNDDCTDGVDNDGNGYSDCDDFACLISPSATVCLAENTPADCFDGVDDDGDGYKGCNDLTCKGSAFVDCD